VSFGELFTLSQITRAACFSDIRPAHDVLLVSFVQAAICVRHAVVELRMLAAYNMLAGAAYTVLAGAAYTVLAGAAYTVLAGAAYTVLAGAAYTVLAGAAYTAVELCVVVRAADTVAFLNEPYML
jgi:hypothetical protein